jgi:hypothetical protein
MMMMDILGLAGTSGGVQQRYYCEMAVAAAAA